MSANASVSSPLELVQPAHRENSLAGKHAWGRGAYLVFKTTIEWFIALGLLLLASPLIALLAILVKATSPGPAFYRQRRVGKNGRIYWMCKLRSMRNDCEKGTGAVWSKPGDPRITRIGRILRDTHMDELPQLIHVLTGSMSLIGPRPERPELIPDLELAYPHYRQRLGVKPGVTGIAQMQLPADTELAGLRGKLAYDIYYVENISLLLDLRIAFSTAMYFVAEVARILSKMSLAPHASVVEAHLAGEAVNPRAAEMAADLQLATGLGPVRPGQSVRRPAHRAVHLTSDLNRDMAGANRESELTAASAPAGA